MMVRLRNEKGIKIEDVRVADSFWKRFLGLMGKRNMPGMGLILLKCSSIHTFFMRFDIDVVYFSKNFKVIGIQSIKPWRFGKIIRGVSHILEIPSGSNIFKIGDIISMEEMEHG